MLGARGVLQTGEARRKQSTADFEARRRADIAKHGLRDCGLPSCSETGEDGQRVCGVLRLSLGGVLLPGTSSAGLAGAQKGVP